jgi:PAS domain S-box-containing protein
MTQASILVVEDEHIVAKDIATRLQRRGYNVVAIAATAGEAIEEAGRHRPDLVLMDIMLKGDVDGITAADKIRDLYGLPIVYLTAYADDNTLQRAKVTDAFGYILKPFEERELSITIEMALYKHRMEARLRESERWLATTLRSIGDAIIAADTRGAITFMNPVAEQLTGWTLEEALGVQLAQVFQTAFEADDTRNGGTTVLVAKTGKRIPIEESAAPIKDDRGETSGIVVVFRDVTDQRRAEEALRLSEARTASSPGNGCNHHIDSARGSWCSMPPQNRCSGVLLRRRPASSSTASSPNGFARPIGGALRNSAHPVSQSGVSGEPIPSSACVPTGRSSPWRPRSRRSRHGETGCTPSLSATLQSKGGQICVRAKNAIADSSRTI